MRMRSRANERTHAHMSVPKTILTICIGMTRSPDIEPVFFIRKTFANWLATYTVQIN